jgi:putative Holliday junction resolvase
MRAIGLDLGSKRIGVAVSDDRGSVATPYDVITRSGDHTRDHRRVREIVEETGAETVVVGLPLSLDGSVGPAARAALAEVDELRLAMTLPIETYDERLTTVSASRVLQDGARMNTRAQRTVIDKVAAAVLLQAWLDGRSARR